MKPVINLKLFGQICFSIAKAHFKLKNEGSFLGLFWYILQPLSLFLVIMFIKKSNNFLTDITYYPVYLIQGLVLFNFFNTIVNSTLTIVIENANILRSTKTSLEILVVSKVMQSLMSHIIEIILTIVIAIYTGIPLGGFLFYPIVIIPTLIFALGVGFISAIIGAYIKDAMNVWRICYQLLMFISPIAYTIHPQSILYTLNLFNPFFYYLEISRTIILGQTLPEASFITATIILSLFSLIVGSSLFNHYKKFLPELV